MLNCFDLVYNIIAKNHCLTLFRMREEGRKKALNQFFSLPSTNVELNLQNFLTFSFNLFTTLV